MTWNMLSSTLHVRVGNTQYAHRSQVSHRILCGISHPSERSSHDPPVGVLRSRPLPAGIDPNPLAFLIAVLANVSNVINFGSATGKQYQKHKVVDESGYRYLSMNDEENDRTSSAINLEQLRDVLSSTIIERIQKPQRGCRGATKQKKRGKTSANRYNVETKDGFNSGERSQSSVEELSEFSDYLASTTFESLPPELQTITHRVWAESPHLQDQYSLPLTSADISDKIAGTLDPAVSESLTTYGIITPPSEDVTTFLAPVLTSYLTAVTTPPPPPTPSATRSKTTECEMCGRDWVPLTCHHLIPRFVHAKALKRGWRREDELQSVAWLCRACHSFVHRFAGHEQLAREFYTVERLLGQDDVRSFASWVGRVRWKAR